VLGLFVERGQSAGHLTVTNVLVLRALDTQNSSSYPLYCEPSKKPLYVDKCHTRTGTSPSQAWVSVMMETRLG
jgi:hypothetical protein